MNAFFVVDDPKEWPFSIPGLKVISAYSYLIEAAGENERSTQVFNLCQSYGYQSLGYYVSLLGEARGHKPLPTVSTIEDLYSQKFVRLLTAGLNDTIQKSLAPIKSDDFTLSIYFGRNVASRYDALSAQIFSILKAPLLRAIFAKKDGEWAVQSIKPIAPNEIPASHHEFVVNVASDYLMGKRPRLKRKLPYRFDLAILYDPKKTQPSSDLKAINKFMKAGEILGIKTHLIGSEDLDRLPEFDALFIRDNTFINHYTYHFSRRAAAQGLVVIDDPDSILRCNNKVYLAELLERHNIATPKTLLVHRGNIDQIVPQLGLPCVLKQPDSALSLGVVKAESEGELQSIVNHLLDKSDLIVAQEYLPTDFDWRIGILERRPLFACKYYMASGHWQIMKHEKDQSSYEEGRTTAMSLGEVPEEVIKTALKAANLIGNGLYGVDLKEINGRCYVIEINDNPNVDAGNEDAILKDALYRDVMGVFAKRIEECKRLRS